MAVALARPYARRPLSWSRLAILSLLAATIAAALPASAGAARVVPSRFYGVNWDREIERLGSDGLRDAENARMATSGVESVRVAFEWGFAQERKNAPYDFTRTDRVVSNAAAHGIDVLPIVTLAPTWARRFKDHAHSPPKHLRDYGLYIRALVQRYGRTGTFWDENPLLPRNPIRKWQIWNEPHLVWQFPLPPGDDYAQPYGDMLRMANLAIKPLDPGAKVVLGGLTNRSWEVLEHLYEKGGIKDAFDVAAIHPYTTTPKGVVELVKRFRKVMRRHGDASKPIWVTELGLPASKGRAKPDNELETTDRGMASFLRHSYRLLVKNLGSSARVARVYWYNWASDYCCDQFRFVGLLRYRADRVEPKPALAEYRRSARLHEGCVKDERARCVETAAAPR